MKDQTLAPTSMRIPQSIRFRAKDVGVNMSKVSRLAILKEIEKREKEREL